MEPAKPEITVIISSYGDRALIPKKLEEIRAQTAFERAEFIFIEPDSPERERELIDPFCREHPNCRLLALDERINLYQAWNLGWSEARAPLVCISNVDDTMHPRLLELVTHQMDMRGWEVGSVLIAKQKYGLEWNSWSPSRLKKLKLITRPGAFFAWRRDLKDNFGMFDENLEIVADKDFWARVEFHRLNYGIIPKVLYLYTFHGDQLSKAGGAREQKEKERSKCAEKAYRHEWPIRVKMFVRLCRVLRSLPFLQSRFY